MRNVQDRPHVVIRYFSREQRVSLGITHARSAARDGEVKAEGVPRIVENGTELHVSEAFVERRLYGMKGLQWGMDGVVIGFSDLPAEGVLRAKVIVGNDDTSSDYWENMPAA